MEHDKKNSTILKHDTELMRQQASCNVPKLLLGPGQTINVWRSNTIKHCLVTKHANVEVSGQTVKTCLIKHKSNN